ncbi:MAG: zinc metallopeptidase [Verrucomicrobiota bacterium]
MIFLIGIFVGTLGISLLASWHVRSTYNRYNQVAATSRYSGAQVAQQMLLNEGIQDVEVTSEPGMLNDHYDPLRKRLVLSPDNYDGYSIAAVSVAAHEVGHAVQHARGYAPLQWRMAAVGTVGFASNLVTWLPLLGMVTGIFATSTGFLMMAIGWGIITLFNLITLPVEYDASRRAKQALRGSGFITMHERDGVDRVLNAAALTYVGALLTSLAWMFYYLLPMSLPQDE